MVALTIGGWLQGLALIDPETPFMETVQLTLPYLEARSLGGTLMTLSHLVFAGHFFTMLVRSGRPATTLTGEPTPRRCSIGQAVLAGSRNGEGTLEVRVDSATGQRRIDRLARSVRHLPGHKSALLGYVPPVIAAIAMGSSTPCVLACSGLFALGARRTACRCRHLSGHRAPTLTDVIGSRILH